MSAVPAVIDAIVSAFKTSVPSTVEVFDGPYLQPPAGDFICVGWSPQDSSAATSTQEWATMGAKKRNEDIDVICYADSYSGSADTVKQRRDGAFGIVALAETALVADPTLGGVLIGWLGVGGIRLVVEQSESGVDCGVEFHITGRARI